MKILVILGFKLNLNGKMNIILKNRLDKSALLYNSHNYDLIIVSGGNVEKSTNKYESDVMKKYLVEKHSIDSKIIIEEKKSKDTNENAIETYKIIKNIKNIKNVTIVTSKFHLERVKCVFSHFYKNNFNLIFKSSKDHTCSKVLNLKKLYENEAKYINNFLNSI
tara:strand:- start:2163 stop:2654 length:492 start_codon:yes stop_codon:yes gene_type:complete